jgi:predicted 3-demethylubiquinone-9 3-methyltransferase (glyoxalase superfamily)
MFTTCLWFDTEGEDAAAYYADVFPNSHVGGVSRYTEGDRAGQAMAVEFELDGTSFVALNGGPEFTFNESISFQVPCKDQDEVDYYWSRLTEGGVESQCGWLKDRYGVSWQIIPKQLGELLSHPDPATAMRVTHAMLAMRKIVIADLEAAAAG